jgi:hypothetical protein
MPSSAAGFRRRLFIQRHCSQLFRQAVARVLIAQVTEDLEPAPVGVVHQD